MSFMDKCGKLQFYSIKRRKKFSSVFFLKFLVIKTLDPIPYRISKSRSTTLPLSLSEITCVAYIISLVEVKSHLLVWGWSFHRKVCAIMYINFFNFSLHIFKIQYSFIILQAMLGSSDLDNSFVDYRTDYRFIGKTCILYNCTFML